MRPSVRALWALAAVLLAWGTLTTVTRGVLGALDQDHAGNVDWRLVYATSRAWLQGRQPYDPAQVREAFAGSAGSGGVGGRDAMNGRGAEVLVYPAPALAAYGVLAWLPWSVAAPLWTVLTLGCFAGAVWCVARMGGLTGVWAALLAGMSLSMVPIHTLLWAGQTAGPVVALVAGASLLIQRSSERRSAEGGAAEGGAAGRGVRWAEVAAGVMLGVATVLKPQVALLFLVYHAGRWRWWVAGAGVMAIAALSAVGAGRMALAEVDWWTAWRANMEAFTAHGDAAPTSNNPLRHQLMNLHYPVHALLGDGVAGNAIVLGVAAGLSAAYFGLDLRRGRARGERAAAGSELVSLSMAAGVTMIVAYHRVYDAVVLIFPVAALLSLRARGRVRGLWARGAEVVSWVVLASFLTPWTVLLREGERRGLVPTLVREGWAWEALVLPAQAWGLLALVVAMVVLRGSMGAPGPDGRAGGRG